MSIILHYIDTNLISVCRMERSFRRRLKDVAQAMCGAIMINVLRAKKIATGCADPSYR